MGAQVEAVEDALAKATHLTELDVAAKRQALILAGIVDDLVAAGEGGRAAHNAIPTLHKILTGLGLTPEGRKLLEMKEQPAGGRLGSIRTARVA